MILFLILAPPTHGTRGNLTPPALLYSYATVDAPALHYSHFDIRSRDRPLLQLSSPLLQRKVQGTSLLTGAAQCQIGSQICPEQIRARLLERWNKGGRVRFRWGWERFSSRGSDESDNMAEARLYLLPAWINSPQGRGQPSGSSLALHFFRSPVGPMFFLNRRDFMSWCIISPHRFFCRPRLRPPLTSSPSV